MNFKITGGRTLHGTVRVNTSKNAAVALLCASLLNKGISTFRNVPRIEEVNRIIEVLESVGVKTKWLNDKDLQITPPTKLELKKLDRETAIKTRSVIMLLGPLMHREKTFTLPHPGGCKLGARSVRF